MPIDYDASICEVTMNKLDTSPISMTYPLPSYKDLESARRLIILVPADSDYTPVTHRVWELANTLGSHILFLSLCTEEAKESSVRRRLITMAAMVQNGKVCAEARVEIGSNWVHAVRSNVQDGDTIVCFAEQRTGMLHRPLSQILQSNLSAPIYILSGLSPLNPPQLHWRSQIMVWVGSIAIIILSFLLQIRIISLSQDWAQTTLLILSVLAEIWLIGIWNRLSG